MCLSRAFGKFGEWRGGNRILVVIQDGKMQLGLYRSRWDGEIEFP